MPDLAMIAQLAEVKSAVLGDLAGGYHDAVREPDGESVAAVMGFVSTSLADAGDQLGLGALARIAVSGEARACLVTVRSGFVTTALVEPGTALLAVERLLDGAGQGKV